MANDQLGPRASVSDVAGDLRARVRSGEFAVGSRLPSTRDLVKQYGISPQAIARVTALLKAEGIVEGRQGSGVFVRSWEPLVYRPQAEFNPLAPDIDVFRNLLAMESRNGSQSIEVSVETPSEPVRRRLNLEKSEPVAVRRRTSYLEGRPFGTDDSFVALGLVEGSDWMDEGTVDRGTNAVLAELGHDLVQALDEVYIRMPHPEETARLKLGPGTPVGHLISTGLDSGDKPVQVTSCILPGDRHVVVYERTRQARANGQGAR